MGRQVSTRHSVPMLKTAADDVQDIAFRGKRSSKPSRGLLVRLAWLRWRKDEGWLMTRRAGGVRRGGQRGDDGEERLNWFWSGFGMKVRLEMEGRVRVVWDVLSLSRLSD